MVVAITCGPLSLRIGVGQARSRNSSLKTSCPTTNALRIMPLEGLPVLEARGH